MTLRILSADEYHGLLCGAGRNAQAISDDHRLDQGREGPDGRPTGASRRALSDRVQAHSCRALDMFVLHILRELTPRPLIARHHKLPWIPNEDDWHSILAAAREEPIRNRVMLAFAYDAGLRREELCSLRTDDIDPSRRTLRIRAETTKGRRERVVPYSVSSSELLHCYLLHRRTLGQRRGPLFLSESRRNYTQPISIWSWSKVVLELARRAHVEHVEHFSTHTLRHLCLTDLARAGWDIHEIAAFAGHRSVQTTLPYIHLSGRDLSAKLAASMATPQETEI